MLHQITLAIRQIRVETDEITGSYSTRNSFADFAASIRGFSREGSKSVPACEGSEITRRKNAIFPNGLSMQTQSIERGVQFTTQVTREHG